MIQAQKSFALKLFEARFKYKNYHSNEVAFRTSTENQTLLVLFVEAISAPKTNDFPHYVYILLFVCSAELKEISVSLYLSLLQHL